MQPRPRVRQRASVRSSPQLRWSVCVRVCARVCGLTCSTRCVRAGPCFHDDYLPAFNLPGVELVDTDGKGIQRITPKGIVVRT